MVKEYGVKRLELIIYRGTHEVGGTVMELKTQNTRILMDAGYPLFLDGELIDEKLVKMPYQKLLEMGVIPEIKGLYRWDAPEFDAVVISHAHSDHFGLLNYIHPDIPIYCTETTRKLIELSLTFPVRDFALRKWQTIEMNQNYSDNKNVMIGDAAITAYPMDHSAFDAAAFEIGAEGKTVIYTGDFRGHGRRKEYLDRFIESAAKEADLLLIEGTTLGRKGETRLTEEELQREAAKIIGKSKGIVLVQPSSQNIDRIISFYHAARACGRILVIDIYMANLLYELNRLGHHLPVPSLRNPYMRVFYPSLLTKKVQQAFGKKYLSRFRLYAVSASQITKKQKSIVMTVRPSMLFDLKLMKLKQGDYIYSLWRAYRSKPQQIKLENYLKSQGFTDRYLHTSGHAFEEDIKRVIRGLDPKRIIPIHTFCPEAFLSFSDKAELHRDGVTIEI